MKIFMCSDNRTGSLDKLTQKPMAPCRPEDQDVWKSCGSASLNSDCVLLETTVADQHSRESCRIAISGILRISSL
jgi:hypothetical protein